MKYKKKKNGTTASVFPINVTDLANHWPQRHAHAAGKWC